MEPAMIDTEAIPASPSPMDTAQRERFVRHLKLGISTLTCGNPLSADAVEFALASDRIGSLDQPSGIRMFGAHLADAVEDYIGYHGRGLDHDLNAAALASWRKDVIRSVQVASDKARSS